MALSIRYVADVTVDAGEQIHVKCLVKPVCGENLPFEITAARWELIYSSGETEAEGECAIAGHEIDAFISPQKTGSYCLKYTYKISDETWVDNVKVTVR